MASKDQLKKKYADELAASSAPGPLLHMIYALSRDRTLSGGDLVGYDGWKGKRASGTQIAMAKKLLGIRSKAKKAAKKGRKKSANGRRKKATSGRRTKTTAASDPGSLVREAIKGYQAILNGAKKEKARLKKDHERAMRALDDSTKDAKTKLAKLRKAGIK